MRSASKQRMPQRIGNYAAIGNGSTMALVHREGSIDWCCLPRFDADARFLALLDARAGAFRIGPAHGRARSRRYLPGSLVLETSFETDRGALRVVDFMPRDAASSDGPPVLIRRVEGVAGSVELEWSASFDWNRSSPSVEGIGDPRSGGVVASARGAALALVGPGACRPSSDGRVRARRSIRPGEILSFVVAHGEHPRDAIARARAIDAADALARTLRLSRAWVDRIDYAGPHAEAVRRSALVLDGLIHRTTGALVAAPTTSLPEALGGVRNWDYRYAWLRDSAMAIHALVGLGHHGESLRFLDWLERLGATCGFADAVRIMYRIDGRPVPAELELEHLDGFRGSRPVRIGNAAYEQTQLDVYGEVLDAAYACHAAMGWVRPALWSVLRSLAERAASRWREPDAGLWEMRARPGHHLDSKLLCWVALDRAIRFTESASYAGDVARWSSERAAIRRAILEHGYDRRSGAFTQTLDDCALDASALRLPLLGFVPADDPRMASTVDRIRERLCDGGLVRRYLGEDGLPHGEGAFALCTTWLAGVLAEMGRIDEAWFHLERVLACANDVGLLAEQIDPSTGELLGNFPQGFSHLGVIDAAIRIERAEARS